MPPGSGDPGSDSGEVPSPSGKAWDDAVNKCQERSDTIDAYQELLDLRIDWASQELVAARSRPAEVDLWKKASECLAERGYPRSAVVDENEFLAWVTGEQIRLGETLSKSELDQHQREMAGDYVDCAEPVWTARTKFLESRRDGWLSTHVDQLKSLTAQIRSVS